MDNEKQDLVLEQADAFAHAVYDASQKLPKYEQFGLTSQLRRAALSVPLNIVEGYARQSKKAEAQFLKIAYGSLKEAQYILQFAVKERYLALKDTVEVILHGSQTGKLLWAKTQTLRKQSQNAN